MINHIALAQSLPLGPGVTLLATHSSGLIAIEKPSGILSHPNTSAEQSKSIIQAAYDEHTRQFSWVDVYTNIPYACTLLHRLDSATSGIVLLALNREIVPWVLKAWEHKKVKKIYMALVKRRPKLPSGIWIDGLAKDRTRQGKVRMLSGKATQAKTAFKWLRCDNNRLGLSLLELNALTGRTHQLRVQCALHGHPIAGDRTYGDFEFNRQLSHLKGFRRLALHAHSLEVQMPAGEFFKVKSKMPESFNELLGMKSNSS